MFRNTTLRVLTLSILLLISTLMASVWQPYSSLCLPAGVLIYISLNILPSLIKRPSFSKRISSDGADLLAAFLVNTGAQAVLLPVLACTVIGWFTKDFWISLLVFMAADCIAFWNGILRVYLSSPIIGIKWRVLGVVCGFVPVANIVVLCNIIHLIRFDVKAEEDREKRDKDRMEQRVCATRYPLLLVHGVFFRDVRYVDYWGRIPKELQKNGAAIYYGSQQSALSVKDSAAEITAKIKEIVQETHCGKVNILAHSKGGLDCRYAITHLGMDKYVASLTTINTPHRGCGFADWLLEKVPVSCRETVENTYNAALRRLGDSSPDFLSAVNDLRASYCEEFNQSTPDCNSVFYQSTGSKINRPLRNIIPLCFTNPFVKIFDGPNDGLVSADSAKWGDHYIYLSSNSAEGISHADMIDMSRHNRVDFDVLEFYVGLVQDLKNRGF